MKRIGTCCLIWAVTIAAAIAPALGEVVSIGDSEQAVREALGDPGGYIRSGSYLLLIYDRGKVELEDGEVVDFSIVSEQEAEERKAQRERRREELAVRREVMRTERHAEGLALKEKTLSDPVFRASSIEKQLAFWRSYRLKYPDVPVDAEYAETLARKKRDAEELATQERLLEMEKRIAQAEAQEAKRDAEDARRSRRYIYPTTPAVGYYDHYYTPTVRIRSHPTTTYFGKSHYTAPCRRPFVWQHDYPSCQLKSGITYSRRSVGSRVHVRVGR